MSLVTAVAAERIRPALDHELELERLSFAAKVRVARAALGLGQGQFAQLIGLTQKSVHRIEHGSVHPTMRTIFRIHHFWNNHGISFEDLIDGGFRLVIDAEVLKRLHA
jgi:DNA-binding XRE family transcriptional regulator